MNIPKFAYSYYSWWTWVVFSLHTFLHCGHQTGIAVLQYTESDFCAWLYVAKVFAKVLVSIALIPALCDNFYCSPFLLTLDIVGILIFKIIWCVFNVFQYTFFLIFIYLFIYLLFLAVLGLRFCVRTSSSCGERGPLFIAVWGPLTIAASLVAEHRLQTRRLSSCGSRAQLLRSMWDLPRPGLEPVSPALAGGLSTTAPPGKPLHYTFN